MRNQKSGGAAGEEHRRQGQGADDREMDEGDEKKGGGNRVGERTMGKV
jgi:hypothetical protein